MKCSNMLSRAVMLLVAVCLVMGQVGDADAAKKKRRIGKRPVAQSLGVKDPRYAAIIMNPITGEVYHSQNADATRYPASLTKMMTLYLLFEALEQKKIDLDDRMEVSALAARQPQTNLSLDEGDRIDVETAIESLVVRSANDVSIVVAERLGGSVEGFARMMTNKARALGMTSTAFKNPNGLPNPAQRTSARDMAKLGIALKRDFPNYYPFFSTLQFSHNGVTYYTHNRVMLRYAGVDGIKTGYIGLSGFNLVTSVARGGRPLVGVVMGGSSGRWRDNRMIELLDQSYVTIARRGAARGKMFPSNLPLSKAGTKQAAGIGEVAPTGAEAILPPGAANIPETETSEDSSAHETLPPATLPPSPFAAAEETPVVDHSVTTDPVAKSKPEPLATPSLAPIVKPAPAAKPAAKIITPPARATDEGDFNWGIQVGAFSSRKLANDAVAHAMRTASRQLVGAKSAVAGPSKTDKTKLYRARISHISQAQARRACEALLTARVSCFTYAMR